MQIAVLRGENAVAKTLRSAVEALERDKAQLQSRVHSLEQRLLGTQASEGEGGEAPSSGEETASAQFMKPICLIFINFCAGDAALEQLREEKEFAEGQVRRSTVSSGVFSFFIIISELMFVLIVSIRSTS